jgi:hypothetical protein
VDLTTTVHMKVMDMGSLPGPPGPWNGILLAEVTSAVTTGSPEVPQPTEAYRTSARAK